MKNNQSRVILGRFSRITETKGIELLDVSFLYQTCKCVCANSNFPPSAQLSYTVGTGKSIGNNAWVFPIYVTGSVTYDDPNRCGCDAPETFRGVVYYTVESETTCAPCLVIDSSSSLVVAEPFNVNCSGKTNQLYVTSSILISVS